jgi:hypothetical protein
MERVSVLKKTKVAHRSAKNGIPTAELPDAAVPSWLGCSYKQVDPNTVECF